MKLAIIPARGGSKRIPRKNVKSFLGKPMLVWSIEAARKSKMFDKIVVNTDDSEIAEIADKFGAEVPFIRPENLSDDYTGINEVMKHTVEWYCDKGIHLDQICCILATAPFLQSEDIRRGAELLMQSDADFAFSVTSFAFPIQRAIKLSVNNQIEMFYPEYYTTRSQDLPEAFHDAGQFYWGTRAAWLSGLPIFGSVSVPVILPRFRVQDIDTFEDWERAETLMRVLMNK